MGRRLTTINASDIKKAKKDLKAINPIGFTGILLKAIVSASKHGKQSLRRDGFKQ